MSVQKPCPVCSGTGLIDVPIGERIKASREKQGMNQNELARQVGMSRPSLCNIEAGKQDVPNVKLVLIARALGVSSDYLLGLSEIT